MNSPLTQQARPDIFEPKIVQLYQHLFDLTNGHEAEDITPSEGFWRELFLLKPEKQKFHDLLEPLTANQLIHLQHHTRTFVKKAIAEAGSGISPRNENALENLTGFLAAVLVKRYTNPSTDIIQVLAGLDAVDKLVSDLVQGIDAIIKSSSKLAFRQKAIDTALAMVSGSYQTSLVIYFIHRDLFPALMKYANDATGPKGEGMLLLGLLANYNKFESQNLYQNRMEDFVNQDTIHALVKDVAHVCGDIRDQYIQVQDDAPVPWSLNSTLSLVGLRALSTDSKKPVPPTEDEARALFNALPPPEASTMLTAYSFVHANKIFSLSLLSTASTKEDEAPLSSFLSVTSYLCHHAHRSTRATHYAELCLLTIRTLLDDTIQLTHISSADNKTPVRLARQRPPHLPHIASPRIPAAVILDICTDTLSHNLRKRLSLPLYNLVLSILHRLITHLDATKTRLQHHWPYIWGSLLSLLRFLTQYATELTPTYAIRTQLCVPLTSLLALCLSRGDTFLPDPTSYDDLFYKLIEVTPILPKFKAAYAPSTKSSTPVATPPDQFTLATNALLSVTSHFQSLLSSSGQRTHQSPATVQKIIRDGYETLPDLQSTATATTATTVMPVDFGYVEKFREVEWKMEIKRILRTVVEDARLVSLKAR